MHSHNVFVLALLLFLAGWLTPVCAGANGPTPLPLPSEILWTGDLDGMMERRQIRFLVVYNEMLYFLDGATQRGSTYELIKLFETEFNRKHQSGALQVQAIFIPVPRDQLIPALLEGRGDVATGYISITPERSKRVDFTEPLMSDLSDVVVTGPRGPKLQCLAGLAGEQIYVRQASSSHENLLAVNERFEALGLPLIQLMPLAPFLEDADMLEMINAGLFPTTVVDEHKAGFWADIFSDLRVYSDIVVNSGRSIAWALRKDSPQLKAALDEFVRGHRKGTLHGNLLFKRYLKKNRWIRNNLAEKELEKFRPMLGLFRKYANRYDLDWLMLAAIAFQESGLDQSKRSERGAVGVMQLLPSTAADPNIGIDDIHEEEGNVHAGAKYLRFLYDRYFTTEAMSDLDKMLFSIAAYNAGPARIRRLRRRTGQSNLDPNRWFRHAEVEAARTLGNETVRYVANVYKYYTAYRLLEDRLSGDMP